MQFNGTRSRKEAGHTDNMKLSNVTGWYIAVEYHVGMKTLTWIIEFFKDMVFYDFMLSVCAQVRLNFIHTSLCFVHLWISWRDGTLMFALFTWLTRRSADSPYQYLLHELSYGRCPFIRRLDWSPQYLLLFSNRLYLVIACTVCVRCHQVYQWLYGFTFSYDSTRTSAHQCVDKGRSSS